MSVTTKRLKENGKRAGISKRKKIIQYDKDVKFIKEWESISKAGHELNINLGDISRCCKGKIKTAGGYIWRYA